MRLTQTIILFTALLFLTACGDTEIKDEKTVPPTSKTEQKTTPEPIPETGAVRDGKTLFTICIACHGDQGQGMLSMNAPGLVNQEAWYLERQLQHFKNGIRGSHEKDEYGKQMSPMAKTLLNAKEIKEVIAYVKTFPQVKTEQTIKGDIENGKDYYNMICGACHGPDGVGNQILNAPKLVGIDDWYLERQYLNFKNEIRGMHPDDKFGFQMQQMSSVLPTGQDLKDVVAYLTSLEK